MHMAVVPVYWMVEVIEDPPRLHDDISQICFFSFHTSLFVLSGAMLALLDVD